MQTNYLKFETINYITQHPVMLSTSPHRKRPNPNIVKNQVNLTERNVEFPRVKSPFGRKNLLGTFAKHISPPRINNMKEYKLDSIPRAKRSKYVKSSTKESLLSRIKNMKR